MDALRIEGGHTLRGEVAVSGSKNSSLPILAATLLADGVCRVEGVPDLQDIRTMIALLEAFGARVERRGDCLSVDTTGVELCTAPYDLVRRMRASICFLGPLLARFGQARISMPGGCVIGDRPVDMHLKGLARLGADFSLAGGYIEGRSGSLSGNSVFLGGNFGPSVLATANIMMAATLARGRTEIEFAACEPEIVDLAAFLSKMGARVEGAGSHLVTVDGVGRLEPADFRVIPDRIEAGTLLMAGLITGGEVTVTGCRPEHLFAVLDKLSETGAGIEKNDDRVSALSGRAIRSTDMVTLAYPGFPTDLQAQFMSLMCRADGTSLICERIFPERFMHAAELKRMGADIVIRDGTAIVRSSGRLYGTRVMASDLRASAALVMAGLVAEGTTEVRRIYHLDRGYEKMEEKLVALGARVERFSE